MSLAFNSIEVIWDEENQFFFFHDHPRLGGDNPIKFHLSSSLHISIQNVMKSNGIACKLKGDIQEKFSYKNITVYKVSYYLPFESEQDEINYFGETKYQRLYREQKENKEHINIHPSVKNEQDNIRNKALLKLPKSSHKYLL